jgi:hypothetical protein
LPGTFYFDGGAFRPPSGLSITPQGVETLLATMPGGSLILAPLVSAANKRFYSALSRSGEGPQVYVFSFGETAHSRRVYPPQIPAFVVHQNLPDGGLLGVTSLAARRCCCGAAICSRPPCSSMAWRRERPRIRPQLCMATVPADATTGPVTVTTPGGTSTAQNSFAVH